jgi:hypothetical protein
MRLPTTLKREARVAFSRKAQPAWFRLTKWIVIVTLGIRFWHSRYFWWGLLGAMIIGLALHAIWRWKTNGWTKPWGGWNDVDPGRKS